MIHSYILNDAFRTHSDIIKLYLFIYLFFFAVVFEITRYFFEVLSYTVYK